MWTNSIFGSFRSMIDDAEKLHAQVEEQMSGGVAITNNNGHIVIVGEIKSLRCNDDLIDLSGKAKR